MTFGITCYIGFRITNFRDGRGVLRIHILWMEEIIPRVVKHLSKGYSVPWGEVKRGETRLLPCRPVFSPLG